MVSELARLKLRRAVTGSGAGGQFLSSYSPEESSRHCLQRSSTEVGTPKPMAHGAFAMRRDVGWRMKDGKLQ